MDSKDYRDISEIKPYPKNPKEVKSDDFDRLKKQIKDLGQYKPIIIDQNNFILGGRTRYMAYKDLGINKVWVSVVNPKNDEERMKFLFSDNDNVGKWIDQDLAEILIEFKNPEIVFKDYKFDFGKTIETKDVIDRFAPEGKKEKDYMIEKEDEDVLTCPECGYEFVR